MGLTVVMDARRVTFAFDPFVGDIDDPFVGDIDDPFVGDIDEAIFIGDKVALALALALALAAVVAREFFERSDELDAFSAAGLTAAGLAVLVAAAAAPAIGDIGEALLGSGGLNGIIVGGTTFVFSLTDLKGTTFVLSLTDLKAPGVRAGDLSLDIPGEGEVDLDFGFASRSPVLCVGLMLD